MLECVRSCVSQQYEPLEVLVYDDASSDGTAEALTQEFPDVRVVPVTRQMGYIALRNRGFREASGEIVFSLDDDSYFTSDRTVERTVELFAGHPHAAAVALPYVEPSLSDSSRGMTTVPPGRRLRSYVGCAHALRRDVVNELGGYREFFIHQGEERDLAIRLLDRGYDIIYGDTPPIVHNYSPQRDRNRTSYYGVRNTLLFDVLNVPFPYVVGRLAADAAKLFCYKLSVLTLPARLFYVTAGLMSCVRYGNGRRPVRPDTYIKYRSLPGHGPLPTDDASERSAGLQASVKSEEHDFVPSDKTPLYW